MRGRIRNLVTLGVISLPAGALGQTVTPDEFEKFKIMLAAQTGEKSAGRYDQIGTISDIAGQRVGNATDFLGLDARVYKDRYTGKAELVFRGTDGSSLSEGTKDWVLTNLPQTAGFYTPSYNSYAPIVVREAVKKYNISGCLGYSQGGGLCNASATPLGIGTTTINPAGLNFRNQMRVDPSLVKNFRSEGDWISSGYLGAVPGQTTTIKGGSGFILGPHDLEAFVRAAQHNATITVRQDLTKKGEDASCYDAQNRTFIPCAPGSSLSKRSLPDSKQYERPSASLGAKLGEPCIDYNTIGPSVCKDDATQEQAAKGPNDFTGKWLRQGGSCQQPIVITNYNITGPGISGSMGSPGICQASPAVPVQYPYVWRNQMVCGGAGIQGASVPLDFRLQKIDDMRIAMSTCTQGQCNSEQLLRCP